MPQRGYSVTGLDPDRTVKCSGRELRISPKASVELCRTIRGMKLPDAKKLLERVVDLKQAIAYRRYKKEVPHKRNLNEPWYAGRYPQKAAGKLLHLLEELEANAEYRNLDVEKLKIIHAASQRGPHVPKRSPRAFGRSDLLRGTTTHVELVGYELEPYMSVTKYFIRDLELKRAGYSKVEMTKSPVGTRVVIYAAKPGMVIGRRGQSIRDLTKVLEEKFGIENPQLSVAAIEIPEQDPKVVASQVAQALQRGVHFRRSAYWAIQRVMESGAAGVEITIRGKLTTERSRYEKFRAGYLPRVGDPVLKNVKAAVADVQLKQNIDFLDKPLMRKQEPKQVQAVAAAEEPYVEAQPATPTTTETTKEAEVPEQEVKEEPIAHTQKA